MRLIKIGELVIEKNCTCIKCKSEFAYTKGDEEGREYSHYAIKCPVCGAYNHFNDDVKKD